MSLEQLLQPTTAAKVETVILAGLAGAGFPVASWSDRNVFKVLVGRFASFIATTFGPGITALAGAGFRTLAKGAWLDLCGAEFYSEARVAAVRALGSRALQSAASAPAYTITPGQLAIESDSGVVFRNSTGGALAPGGSLTLTWRAELEGESGNVDAATCALLTPLAGVSLVAAIGLGWLTTQGADAELDEAYSKRLGEKWSSLNATDTPPADAYSFRAKSVDPAQITRVVVLEETPTAGSVTMYLGGPAGPVSSALAATVAAAFEANYWRPRCVSLYVLPAISRIVAISGVMRVRSGYAAAALASIDKALAALERSASGGDVIDLDELRAIVRTSPGCIYSSLTSPIADITLASSELAVFDRTGLVVTEI